MISRRRSLVLFALAAALVVATFGAALAQPSADTTMTVTWITLSGNLTGGHDNGFASTCGDAHATGITFTVANSAGRGVVSHAPCPAADGRGTATIRVPAGTGLMISATIDGAAPSRSEHVCPEALTDDVTVRIFVAGCDQGTCTCTSCPCAS